MPRPIPGARFIACLLGGASLFGGAAALADAGRIGLTQFVAVPEALPGGLPVDAASIEPTLEPEPFGTVEAAEAVADADAADAPAEAEAPAEGSADDAADEPLLAAVRAPRLRPSADGEGSG